MLTRPRFLTLTMVAFAAISMLAESTLLAGKGGKGGKPPSSSLSLSVTITPATIAVGDTATVTVTHNNADTTGSVTVTLESTAAEVTVPATKDILANATSTEFTVTAGDDGTAGNQAVTITAKATGYLDASGSLTVTDPPLVRYALQRFSMPADYFFGNVSLRDINDVGEVVGYYSDAFVAGGEQPFYFDIASGETVATNLNDLVFDAAYGVPAGWYIDAAHGINNWGQIAAALTKVGEPDLLQGCVIELRPDPTDLTALPRIQLIPETADWPHTYCMLINDEGVVLGGDTYLDVAYVYHLVDRKFQPIGESFDVWNGGRGVYLTNPVNGGPSLVKVALGNEVLTYDVVSGGDSTSTPQDDAILGFNDYEHYCGIYTLKRRTKGYMFDGTFRPLNDIVYADDLNNDGDVIGRSGGRAFLDHAEHGSISLDATIVAPDEERSIWDASPQPFPVTTLSIRNATGFPVVSGMLQRGNTGEIFYDGYVLIPMP